MSKIIKHITSHIIEGQGIDFTVFAPTQGDRTTRRMTVTDADGNSVNLDFEYDGFELLKALINQY